MELPTIQELLRRRRKLVKSLGDPPLILSDDPKIMAIEKEVAESFRQFTVQQIADIETEIRERTGQALAPEPG